jgi:hypothetical protein
LHAHPSIELRSVGRTTLDDWIRFCHAESTVRLEGVLRSALQARGLPSRLHVVHERLAERVVIAVSDAADRREHVMV